MPLVRGIARSFRSSLRHDYDFDDLCAIGMMNLWDAAKRYDPEHEPKTKFSTYARRVVLHGFLECLVYAKRKMRRDRVREFSIQGANRDADTEDGYFELALPSTEGTPEDHLSASELRQAITRSCAELTEREVIILRERTVEQRALDEIASEWGVSRERIRQIERRSMQKLQVKLRARLQMAAGGKPLSISRSGLGRPTARKVAAKEPVT